MVAYRTQRRGRWKGDGSDGWDPCVSDREEKRRSSGMHKTEGNMTFEDYAKVARVDCAWWGGHSL
jgi:hypothetical protein